MSYDSIILADVPVAYRKLADLTTTAADSSAGGADTGTYSGAYTQNQASILPGDTGKATLFAGGYVTVTETPFGTGDFSWEIWCKGAVAGTTVLRNGGSYWLGIASGVLTLSGATGGALTHQTTMLADTLYHVVLSRVSGVMTLYLNGVACTTTQTDTADGMYTSSLIGALGGGFQYQGTLQNEAVYNGANALTPTKVTAHYDAGASGPPTTASFDWSQAVYSGQWTANNPALAGRVYAQAQGTGATAHLLVTGTGLSLSAWTQAATAVEASLDGGATWANITPGSPANAWTTLPVFTGLSDVQRHVAVRITSSFGLVLDQTADAAFIVTGGAPACAADPDQAGNQYLPWTDTTDALGRPGFLAAIRSEGSYRHQALSFSSTDVFFPNGDYQFNNWNNYGYGDLFRFRATVGRIDVFTYCDASVWAYTLDGVLQAPRATAPATHKWQWVTVASGLDTASEHEYGVLLASGTVADTNAGSGSIHSLRTVGGTGVNTSPAARPAARDTIAFYGDSITQHQNADVDVTRGWVVKVGDALGMAWAMCGIASTPVDDYTGRTGTTDPTLIDYITVNSGEARTANVTAITPAPTKVVVLYGTNDMLSPYAGTLTADDASQFQTHYGNMLASLLAGLPGTTQIYCVGILPRYDATSGLLATWRASIQGAVTANGAPNLHYVDPTPWQLNGASGTDYTTNYDDGIHPNLAGADLIAAGLIAEVGGPDTTPPTLSSRTVPSSGATLTATLSEAGCVPASGTGGFSVSGTSATVASWVISGTTLTITLTGTVQAGETVTLSYDRATTADDIADAAGNFLANISAASVTNNSTQGPTTATATFSATNAAVLRCGQINPGSTAGRPADMLISAGCGYDFTVTNCTALSIPFYRTMAAGMTVSVDGGAATALTMPATGAWADVVVFTGLSTVAHTVSLRLTAGSTYIAVDSTNTFQASNVGSATVPTISATKAGPSYRIIDPAFRRNASVEGPYFRIPSMNTGTYNTPILDWPVYCGQRIAFRGDPTEVRLFMVNDGGTFSLVVDGVVTGAKVTTPVTGLNDWFTVASGLSGTHDYAVQGDAPGYYQIFAIQLVGGTLATKTYPAAGHLVVFGDSISIATGTTRASKGYAAQVARAKDRRLLNLSIGGATVSSSVDVGRTGTIAEFAGDYLAWVDPGWDTSQDEVVMLAGFNDANYIGDLTAFMDAYSSALTQLAATGATVRVLGYLESLGGPATANRAAWNSALSTAVSGLGLARITYYNTTGWVDTATDLADFVHLNQSGDDKVATQLGSIVTPWTAPPGGGGVFSPVGCLYIKG